MLNEKKSKTELIDLYYFAIGDGNFIQVLERYSNRRGFGYEHIWCLFSGELEEWEEGYFGERGVCYFFDYPAVAEDQALILDYANFYHYLEKASRDYLNRYPNTENEVKAYLNKIKIQLDI